MSANPFTVSLVRLQLPAGSTSVSVGGFNLEADEDGCIEVPREIAAQLRPHGLVDVPAKGAKAPEAKK